MSLSEEEISETTTLSTVDAKDLPLDLYDIGYMGTWERFCNPEEIEKDFAIYPHHHQLMLTRHTICELRRQNRINREAVFAFTFYKYCELVRENLPRVRRSFPLEIFMIRKLEVGGFRWIST